jgi:hypothetical protein
MENRSVAARAGINVAALAIFFAVFFIAAPVTRRFDSAPLVNSFEVLTSAVALWIAWRLRAGVASVLIGGFGLFFTVEFAFHLIFGYHAVQSGPTHLAIMFASILGVAAGALSLPRFANLRSSTS